MHGCRRPDLHDAAASRHQIRPGFVADFPKLASSAAHLFGRPQIWTEQGGGAGPLGKFTADYQLVRGINYLNVRGIEADPAASSGALMDRPASIARYVSRAGYLLSVGRPAAQVALFHPTDSLWLGDEDADKATVRLTTQLMERQIDLDQIDTDTLTSVCTVVEGGLQNLSGQIYRAVVIPSCTAISRAMLERLKVLARTGVKVVFVGRTPTLVYDRNFLEAKEGAPDLSFATLVEPKPEITDAVAAVLPRDFTLDAACPPIKYVHRTLKNAEAYFVFNESAGTEERRVTLRGSGQVQRQGSGNPLFVIRYSLSVIERGCERQRVESVFRYSLPDHRSFLQEDAEDAESGKG